MNRVPVLFIMLPVFAIGILFAAWRLGSHHQGTQVAAYPGSVEMTNPSGQDPVIGIGFKRVIHSNLIGEDRVLFVYLPNGYEPSKSENFPLFVYLDAWGGNVEATVGMIHGLSEGRVIPRMVVVGISNASFASRDRDLTPMKIVGNDDAGGGANFLASIKTEVLPYIDASWPTNGFRTFCGHSIGGLTVLNFLVNQPDLFDAYIALTPSMEVGKGLLLDQTRDFLRGRKKLDKMLYLSIGDEQLERIYFDQLVEFLRNNSPRGFLWASGIFDAEDDHRSIRITGKLAGLRWVFRDWRLASNRIIGMTRQEITDHYIAATRRYKQKRSTTMMEITDAGYWALYDPKKVDRAMELFHMAIQMWPAKAFPHSALGEGLEWIGELDEALVEMELALKMDNESGDVRVPGSYYQTMVTRVKAKLDRGAPQFGR